MTTKKQKRDEILKQLKAMTPPATGYRWDRDPESDHSKADDLLLELIDDAEIKQAFDDIDKWYA